MESLSIRGVEVNFGGLKALAAVDVHVPEGSIYGLIGPNGAGKTTLFNCVSRFQRYSAGAVSFQETDLGPLGPHDVVSLGIARTFQNINLFRTRSTLDNILIGMHCHKGNPVAAMLSLPAGRRRERAMRARAGSMAEMFGRKLGVTVVVVEHDMSLVRAVCDEITVLDFGRNIARGSPAEILNHPAVIEAYLGEAAVHA